MRIATWRAAPLCALLFGGVMSAGCCYDDGVVLRGDWSIQLSGRPSYGCCEVHRTGAPSGPCCGRGIAPPGPGPGIVPGTPAEGVEQGVSARFHPVPTSPLFRPIPATKSPADCTEDPDESLPEPQLEGSSSPTSEPGLPLPPPQPADSTRIPREASTRRGPPTPSEDATVFEALKVYRRAGIPPQLAVARRVDSSWDAVEAFGP